MRDVIVMGAGVSGLVCAKALSRSGFKVTVLEKARGVGGRMATRRIQDTWVDHGTQYLTVRGSVFERFIQSLQAKGIVREWTRSVYRLDAEGLHEPPPDEICSRYVCPEGMTALAKHLAVGLDVQLKQRVVRVEAGGNAWQLITESGQQWSAATVVSTLPAPQFLTLFESLLAADRAFLEAVRSVEFHPSLAVMAGYPADRSQVIPSAWQAIECPQDPILAWIALDSSRRSLGRAVPVAEPVFVLQSSADFARQYLEGELDQAGLQMLTQAAQLLAPWLREPAWWQVHRWRYALPSETLGVSCLTTTLASENSPLTLLCAGDWCIGPSVESACLSGLAAAEQLTKARKDRPVGQI